jgi:hypothetical protein
VDSGNVRFIGRGTGSGHDEMRSIGLSGYDSGLEPPFSKRRLPFAFGSLLFAIGGSQKKKQAAGEE